MINFSSPYLPPSFVQSRLGLRILVSTVDEYRHVLIGGVDEDEDDERNSRISLWGNRARKNVLSLKSKVVSLGMSRDKGNEGKDEVDKAGLEAGLRGGDEGVELTSITARTTSVFESTNPMARDVGKSDLGDLRDDNETKKSRRNKAIHEEGNEYLDEEASRKTTRSDKSQTES